MTQSAKKNSLSKVLGFGVWAASAVLVISGAGCTYGKTFRPLKQAIAQTPAEDAGSSTTGDTMTAGDQEIVPSAPADNSGSGDPATVTPGDTTGGTTGDSTCHGDGTSCSSDQDCCSGLTCQSLETPYLPAGGAVHKGGTVNPAIMMACKAPGTESCTPTSCAAGEQCNATTGQCETAASTPPPTTGCTPTSCGSGLYCDPAVLRCVPEGNCESNEGCVQQNGGQAGWTCNEEMECSPPPPSGVVGGGTPKPSACTPSIPDRYPSQYFHQFDRGHKAVSFVITAYENHDCSGTGYVARFVEDTPVIAMGSAAQKGETYQLADGSKYDNYDPQRHNISCIKVYKGPNYVTGDFVELYKGYNYKKEWPTDQQAPDLVLHYPGTYDLTQYGFDKQLRSFAIKRSPFMQEGLPNYSCADPNDPKDDLRWHGEIRLITEIYENSPSENGGGMSEQIISDVPSLTQFGLNDAQYQYWNGLTAWHESFNDSVSSVRVLKGPDYQENDYVILYENIFSENAGGTRIVERPVEDIFEPTHYLSNFNDKASAIYFYNGPKGDGTDSDIGLPDQDFR
jgi:hypothetical protein